MDQDKEHSETLFRTTRKWDGEKWVTIEFKSLKPFDLFVLVEPDGIPVNSCGCLVHVATSDPYPQRDDKSIMGIDSVEVRLPDKLILETLKAL